MRIELEKLEGGRGDFAHIYQPDELDPIDERVSLAGPAEVKGRVRRTGVAVAVDGHIDTRVKVECDRCLKPVELPVITDFALEYITEADYESSSAAALNDEEMSVSVFDGESIDVDEIVKEQVLLAVPARTLCREDCKGICPECGIDLNTGQCSCAAEEVDPRWAALKDLKNTDR
jgi:DUF177 domain-containing protein